MASVGYHEPVEELSDETRDMHRAIVSLMEELEAVDWYDQRADACKDEILTERSRIVSPFRGDSTSWRSRRTERA
jgi:hypothetical protein